MAKTISTGFITDTINGIKVNSSIKCNSGNFNNNASRTVAYPVIHYTGNAKDTAKANANYFTGAGRGASAHFFVDDSEIYQSVELRDTAWHCGTKGTYYHSACRNANSIGIEMCCTAGNYKVSEKTKKNTAYLCAYICKMLGITTSGVDTYVLRHYDVTHKKCPAQMVDNEKEWAEFKDMVKSILWNGGVQTEDTTAQVQTTTTKSVTAYKVKVTASVLNIRKGPGTGYGIVGQLKNGTECEINGEAVNGGTTWGRLSDSRGYISLEYTKKTGATPQEKTTSGYTVKVTASTLNVRKGPGTNYGIVTTIKKGEKYTIIGEAVNGGTAWGKLKSGAGYISLAYTQRV